MDMRRKIFEILQPDDGRCIWSRLCDWLITSLILSSVVIVFVATFNLSLETLRVLSAIECFASVVFTIEYLLRIATADYLYPNSSALSARLRYIVSPMAVIDLAAILPFWLPMIFPGTMLGLRALRLVRLLRIFKLNRYFDAMQSLVEVVVSKKRELLCSVFVVGILMVVASLLMYSAEHDKQPEVFRNAFSGLWWAVATLTTVGYGDIYPVTVLGRIVGAFIAFSGLAAVAIPTGIISSGLMEKMSQDEQDASKRTEEITAQKLEEHSEMLKKILEKMSAAEMQFKQK